MKNNSKQLILQSQGHGGIRAGAGWPSKNNGRVSHKKRETITNKTPAHVTVRLRPGMPSLRTQLAYRLFRKSVLAAKQKGLRVLQFAVLGNHFHLMVEANDNTALAAGMQSLNIRLSKGFKTNIFNDRYHLKILLTPTQVHHALIYIFSNASKHFNRHKVFDWFCSYAIFGAATKLRQTGLDWGRPPLSATQKQWFLEILLAAQSWLARSGWLRAKPHRHSFASRG